MQHWSGWWKVTGPRAAAMALLWMAVPLSAGMAEVLVELNDVRPDEILMVGFELPREADLTVEAVGLAMSGKKLVAYAWILDNKTRKTVWEMDRRHRDRSRSEDDRIFVERELRLPAGRYELYYTAVGLLSGIKFSGGDFEDLSDVVSGLAQVFGGKSSRQFERELRNCYVKVHSDQVRKRDVKTFEVTGEIPGALVMLNGLGDDEYVKQGFELKRPGQLRVYALVEIPSKTAVDRAWIVNAETHQRVWETTPENTDPAGGGSKNRVADEEIDLEAGKYVLYYASDDSHSWEFFNTAPPYDPVNWGVMLLPGRNFQRSSFALYEPPGLGEPLIDLTRARDDDYLQQAFRITRETQVYVKCVGEYSGWSDQFADYGGIQDAVSGRLVCEMTGDNTHHAGGAEKNRMFEETVRLPPGTYLAFYSTDDSHAYRDWNASAPFESEAWGLAIYPGPGYRHGDLEKVAETDIADSDDLLARIVRVRDDEHRTAEFVLERPTRVRVYALGEGSGGDMYDYGWIEDKTSGRAVWEMTWRKTRHAGGADKNREFDGEIMLEAGTYEVHYVTDGSHSFNDWNASRPRNPMLWGITVSVSEAS